MQLLKSHIESIQKDFAAMQTREDFRALLNDVNKIIYGEKFIPMHLKSITYYSNPSLAKGQYKTFTVPKKNVNIVFVVFD